MANSIRTPKLGTTVMSRRIAQAVDNEMWQMFRISLKGKTTEAKLAKLKSYYFSHSHKLDHDLGKDRIDINDCDICIRVDNYIKALCRGGQLKPKESLRTALDAHWKLEVVK